MTKRRWIGSVVVMAALVLGPALARGNTAQAQPGPIPPVRSYVVNDATATTGLVWRATSVFWDLPPLAPGVQNMGDHTLLGFLESPFTDHNALTLLPIQAPARSWTILGEVVNVWQVAADDYAILVLPSVHTPPPGLAFMEEVLGLDLQHDTLRSLWIYRGRFDTDSYGSKADGTACGVVIGWLGKHISLRAIPGTHYPGEVQLALFAGTNTCK